MKYVEANDSRKLGRSHHPMHNGILRRNTLHLHNEVNPRYQGRTGMNNAWATLMFVRQVPRGP